MFNKVYDEIESKKFYNIWTKKISDGYSQMSKDLIEAYNVKNELDTELAQIYVERLVGFYAKLKFLNNAYNVNLENQTAEQRKQNYNVIQLEVDDLIKSYKEFIKFVLFLDEIYDNNKPFNSVPASFFMYEDLY